MTRSDYWNRFNSRQRAIEKKFIGSVYSAVRGQYNAFLTSVRNNGYQWSKQNINAVVTAEGIVKVLKKLYRYAAYVEGNYVLSSLIKKSGKKSFELDMEMKRVRSTDASFSIGLDEIADVVDQYFRIYQLNISALPITETTKRHIEDHLIAEVERGVPLNEAIKNFREQALTGGASFSRNRARLISLTEGTRSMNFGGLIGAYMSGIDVDKVWITSADEKVRTGRYSHQVLDGQVSTLFGAFRNSEEIKFPGDPEASIGNTVRCRCTQYFRKSQREQRPIARQLSSFIIDFFTGFFAGTQLAEMVLGNVE